MKRDWGFKVESLAFVAFLVTVPFYSPNLVPLVSLDADGNYLSLFVKTLLVATSCIALLVAVLALRASRLFVGSTMALSSATAAYLAGLVVLVGAMSHGWPVTTVVLSAVLCSLGVVPLGLAWGRYFSSFSLRQALMHAVVLGGIASLLGLMLSALSGTTLIVMYAAMLVLGCGVPLVRSALGLDGANQHDAPRTGLKGMLRNSVSVLGEPLAGLLLFAFIMGVRKLVLLDAFYAENIGGLVAAALVVPLLFRHPDEPLISFAFRLYLPICALVLIVLDSFPVGTFLNTVGAFGIYAFLTLVALVAAASLVAASHAREFPTIFVFGVTMGLFCVSSLLGVLVGSIPVVADNPGPLLLVLSTAYMAMLILASVRGALKNDRPHDSLPDGNSYPSLRTVVGSGNGYSGCSATVNRCDDLAERSVLSPREAEILGYMGRGYAPAHIARSLVLSESTVRTHVQHIYRKLEVTSREQLLDLINCSADRDGEGR